MSQKRAELLIAAQLHGSSSTSGQLVDGASTPEDRPVVRVLFGDQKPRETPIDDFSGLKVRGISSLRELDFHEAANIANAIVDYLRQGKRKCIDFGLESARSLHKDMFCDVWDWAGTFRTCDLNIGSILSKQPTMATTLRWSNSTDAFSRCQHVP
jgi:hypothetical protein